MQLLGLTLVLCLLIALLGSWLPGKLKLYLITLVTIFFLVQEAPLSLAVLAFTTVTSYGISSLKIPKGWAIFLLMAQSISLFVFFKLGAGEHVSKLSQRLIPLGLSYYLFRQIHYAIESYKGKLHQHGFWDYAGYMFFLPTFLVGPIHRFQPFLRDISRRSWDPKAVSKGLQRILYGYAMIVVLGNQLVSKQFANYILNIRDENLWLATYLDIVRSLLNEYFQFAGFSAVAIGLALILGFKVMENFNFPLTAPNISAFWDRWHISLSSWCKDYIYTPVAGMTRKPYLSILLTMLGIGLWHEISIKYLVWGLVHAFGIMVWHYYKNTSIASFLNSKIPRFDIVGRIITFHFVAFSFYFVAGDNWQRMWEIMKILVFIN